MNKENLIQVLSFFLILFLLPTSGISQKNKTAECWTMTPAQNRVLKSKILKSNVRLQVDLPDNYESNDDTYGVVYCLDGFVWGGTIRETAYLLQRSEEIPKLIVVCLDLDVNTFNECYERRSYILTPTKSDTYKDLGIPESWTGGGSEFLKCFMEEIIPFIENEYRANSKDRTIVGHSFGGLFASYVLFNAPDTFHRYLISSPSLQWDDRVIFKYESNYAKQNSELPAKVFLSIGGEENRPDDMTVF